jgi:hypothetical protein
MNHEDAKADITVRLRHATHPASATALLVLEAVDEIAKLRAALRFAHDRLASSGDLAGATRLLAVAKGEAASPPE